MTSQINPNPIDSEYPVAGQDNNTQGFRDNFTSIKTNLQYAADEITALQANSVLTTNGTNNLSNTRLYGASLVGTKYIQINAGNVAPTANINFNSGSYQTITANANTTLNFTNLPAAGNTAIITVAINAVASAANVAPFNVTIANAATGNINTGITGLVGNILSFPRTNSVSAGVHTYQFQTDDQGSSFTITPQKSLDQPLNASSEDVANVGVINLGVSDSYFSTSGDETATLPAGVNGQVKVLAMLARVGNMVVTVTNPAWAGAGTVTFSAVGQACTLKYINSKWFCIGNNSCTFA